MNNFWSKDDWEIILTPSCFSRQDESKRIHYDLERSMSKFDLMSRSADDIDDDILFYWTQINKDKTKSEIGAKARSLNRGTALPPYISSHMHAFIHAYIQLNFRKKYVQPFTISHHIHTHTHTHTHMYNYTHTHTRTQTYKQLHMDQISDKSATAARGGTPARRAPGRPTATTTGTRGEGRW